MANTLGDLAQGTKRVIQSALELSLRRLRSYIDARDADTSAAVNAAERSAKSYTDTKVDDEHVRAHEAEQTLQTELNNEKTRAKAAENANANSISNINDKIPTQATSQNKLADKDFVNSSIATATATYISKNGQPFSSLSELQAYTGAHDKNDYAFVRATDSAGNVLYERYKFDGTSWALEYTLNNSSFTQAQWDAINSAITSGLVSKLSALPTKAQLDALFNAKQDTISDLNTIRQGAAKGATSYQKPSGGIPKTDLSDDVKASLDKADTALQEHQDISDKVDKIDGKGLSTNDYTNAEKARLAELENYDDTQVRQLITQTNANFANYYTKAESYSATEVDTLLRTQRQGQFVVVSTLPAPSADTMFKIYLVPSGNPETQNVKDEFVTLENNGTYSWEQIGTTAVDLSGYSTTEEMNAAIASALGQYYTKTEVDEALGGKQNTIDDIANIRSGAQAGSTAVQPSTLNNVVKNTVAESGVYDVSANNDNTKFESLSALLSSANLNTLIPTDIRKGGMSIKFVLSSDNKYVQYRLMSDEWSTTVANWQGVDDVPTANSNNLVKSGGVYPIKEKTDIIYVPVELNAADWHDGQYKKENNTTANLNNASWIDVDVRKNTYYIVRTYISGTLAFGLYKDNTVLFSTSGSGSNPYLIYVPNEDGYKLFISSTINDKSRVRVYQCPYDSIIAPLKKELNDKIDSTASVLFEEVNIPSENITPSTYIKKNGATTSWAHSALISLPVVKNTKYLVHTRLAGNLAICIKDNNNNVYFPIDGTDAISLGIRKSGDVFDILFDIPNVDNCTLYVSCYQGYGKYNKIYKLSYFDLSNEEKLSNLKADVESLESEVDSLNTSLSDVVSGTVSEVSELGVLDIAFPTFDYNHILIYGQSFANGGGYCGNGTDIPGNYKLGTTIGCNSDKSEDTLRQLNSGHNDGQIASQCTNAFSLLWNRYTRSNAKFIAMCGGMGDSCIEQINKGTVYYTNMMNCVERVKSIADTQNKTAGCIAVIYVQGESNYSATSPNTRDKTEYKKLLLDFKNDIQNDLMTKYGQSKKPIFIIYQTGEGWINNKDMTITQAQYEFAMENDDVILGCPSYPVSMGSNKHPNGDGYAHIGELMAKHLFNALCWNRAYESCHPLSFTVNGNIVTIKCYVPIPPLRIDTHTISAKTDYGFAVFADNVKQTITNIKVEGCVIQIHTQDSLDNKVVEVQYAGKECDGYGNICDSDNRYTSFQTISGIINTYPLTTSPKDINGRSLVGKHIPLQNWLSNFYFNLNFGFATHYIEASVGETSFANKLINTTSATPTFTSSDSNVVTVGSDGSLTFVGSGYAKVTATITTSVNSWSDSYLVKVVETT